MFKESHPVRPLAPAKLDAPAGGVAWALTARIAKNERARAVATPRTARDAEMSGPCDCLPDLYFIEIVPFPRKSALRRLCDFNFARLFSQAQLRS